MTKNSNDIKFKNKTLIITDRTIKEKLKFRLRPTVIKWISQTTNIERENSKRKA